MKRLASGLTALFMLASMVFVAPVAATPVEPTPIVVAAPTADEGGSCPTDPERVRLYENNIGDTSDGNDTFLMCGTGIADLDARAHTSPGLCKSGNLRIGDTWNDCVSSVYPFIPANTILCLYGAKNYGPPYVKLTTANSGYRQNLAGGFGLNDGLSSLRFMNAAAIFCQ